MLKVILGIGAIQAVAVVIQFARSKFVAVTLGPEGVGVVGTIDQIVQFAAFATAFSLPLASVKFLSKAHSESPQAFRQTYAGFLKIILALAVAGTISTMALVLWRPEMLGAEVEKYSVYLLVALVGLPSLVLGGFFTNVFAAAQNYRASAALAVVSNAALAAAVIAGILAAGVFGLFVGGAAASVALTCGIFFWLRKKYDLPLFSAGDGGANVLAELRRSPDVLSFAAMLYLGSVSYSLSALAARYSVLTNFGEAETGLLQGALVLSVAVGMILNPANGLYLTPVMNRGIPAAEKILHAAEFQRKLIFILCLVSLPVVMFPELMLTLMFSSKFVAVGNLVFLFVVAMFIKQLAGVHQALMIGTDDLKVYTLITVAGEIGFALLAWFLVPIYGIRGAAFGSIVSSLAIFLATLLRLRLKQGYVVRRGSNRLLGYGLAVLIVAGLICSRADEWDLTVAALKIGFFSLFVVSLFFFLNDQEKASFGGLKAKLSFGR